MKKFYAILVMILSTLSLGTTSSEAASDGASGYNLFRGNPVLASHGKYVDQLVADFITKNHLPGLSMAIVQAPYIPRSAGYGRASLVNDELASTKTMWNVGPITQAFTAVAIFQLYEAHKVDIQDPVGKYVKDLPAAWNRISLFQLLQHASGIPDYRKVTDSGGNSGYQPLDLLARVKDEPLLFRSGTQVRMSATDFILLGLVIEQASGMSFHDYITRYQIEPLDLRGTMFLDDFKTKAFLDRPTPKAGVNQHVRFLSEASFINPVEPATGYRLRDGQLVPVDANEAESLFAFGDLWSTAEDISKWDIALAGNVLLKSAEDRAMIYQPTKLANGSVVPAMAGWEFTRHPGFMEIKGTSPGFSSYLSRFTAANELVCVTLLTNKEGVDLTNLARDIAEAYQAGLGSGLDPDQVVSQESKYSVRETVARVQADLKSMHVPVFATFDHADNATKAGLQLRPTTVLVFGSAKVGTKLMLDNQAIALELPLRLSIWEDERGRVWVGYPNLDQLADEYHIKDAATVSVLSHFMENLVNRAVNVYAY
jgi:CubicO group peptidase (beta-lactamase class C family)